MEKRVHRPAELASDLPPAKGAKRRAPRRDGRISHFEIHARLSAGITDHRLPPGTRLPEEAVAQVFGVSRARVREVLLKLNHEHLVTLQPNRGAFVAKPSVEETRQICEARRLIEPAMVSTAARAAKPTDLHWLQALIEREAQAWTEQDRHKAVRLSREFHLAIATLAGNEILAETLRNILSRNALSVALYGGRGSPGCLCEEHFGILEAIREGNEARAAELMTAHLDHIERRLNLVEPGEHVDLAEVLRNAF